MVDGVVGLSAWECRRGGSLGRRGTPGDVGMLAAGGTSLCCCTGSEAVLLNPSLLSVTARDCRCDETFLPSVRGVLGCVRGAAAPLKSIADGRFGLRRPACFESPEPGRTFFDVLVLPVTVALLPSFCAGGKASDITSSIGRGRLACAIAKGPACCGSIGKAIPANTRLESTVTGKTFSCIFSRFSGSPPPKTILCTLLYNLRQVWKAFEAGCGARSWR